MPLLQAKIELCCSFTVNLGPQYVERVLDAQLIRQGLSDVVRMSAPDRLERYLQLLHQQSRSSNRRQYAFLQFYMGHFSQQLTEPPERQCQNRHFKEKAICHYENYLDLADGAAESRFYAQWQSAVLQAELEYPWAQPEAGLLKAAALDPARGEPVSKLIGHFCRTKAWKAAYSLSALALRNYFDKNPVATRRWFVDFAAYDWHLLHTHFIICYKSGHLQEANQAHRQLLDYAHRYPDELGNADIRLIHGLERLFGPRYLSSVNRNMPADSLTGSCRLI
jgi:hypothetical protein